MSEQRECAERDCYNRTREGKPYCPDHVCLNRYVVQILADIDRMEAEKKAKREKS